jgi:hypothetical protein
MTRMWSRSTGQVSTDNGYSFRASFSEGWQIVHTVGTNPTEMIDALALEAPDTYPGTFVPRKSFGAVQKLGPIFSIVPVNYEGAIGPSSTGDSPLNQIPEPSWTSVSSECAIDEDWDGNAIVTANGELIHGLTMELADQVVSIKRNYALFNPWLVSAYRHSTNSDFFYDYAPGTARLVDLDATPQLFNAATYWEVIARVQFRYPFRTTFEKAWYARTLHQGLKVRGADGVITHAIDEKTKNLSTVPVLLKADGTLKGPLDPPHYLEFKRYNSLPFSALGLV